MLGISKSTLSDWLSKYPLSAEQFALLENSRKQGRQLGIERTRYTKKLKREKRLAEYLKEAKKTILPLSKRELFLAGLFLYWGEGGKTERGLVSISNTDPSVLKFSLIWITEGLDIPKNKVRVLLHLYDDMIIDEVKDYWSKALNIPISQFTKPYIKKSKKTEMDYKGFGHGTCMLRICDTILKEKIIMGIRAIGNYSEEYIRQEF